MVDIEYYWWSESNFMGFRSDVKPSREYQFRKICKCSVSNYSTLSNFCPLEVVGRGSETQLQVGENWNYLTWRLLMSLFYLFQCGRQLLDNYASAHNNFATWDTREIFVQQEMLDCQEEMSRRGSGSLVKEEMFKRSSGSLGKIRPEMPEQNQNHIPPASEVVTINTRKHSSTTSHSKYGGEDENENTIPTKMIPALPVTTETTRMMSERNQGSIRIPQQKSHVRKYSSGGGTVREKLPPPPPHLPGTADGLLGVRKELPPPPSPKLLESIATHAASARQSLRRVSDGGGVVDGRSPRRVSDAASQQGPKAQVHIPSQEDDRGFFTPDRLQRHKRISSQGSVFDRTSSTPSTPEIRSPVPQRPLLEHRAHSSVPASPVRVPNQMVSVPEQSVCHAPPSPSAGVRQGIMTGHRRTSSGPPAPPLSPKPKIPPPAPPTRSNMTQLSQDEDDQQQPQNFMADLQRALSQKQTSTAPVPQPILRRPAASTEPDRLPTPPLPPPPPTTQPIMNTMQNVEDLPPPPAELLEELRIVRKKPPPPPPKRNRDTHLSQT